MWKTISWRQSSQILEIWTWFVVLDQELTSYFRFAEVEVLRDGCRWVNPGSHAGQRGRCAILTDKSFIEGCHYLQTLTTVFGNGFPDICVSELSCAAVTENLNEIENRRISDRNSPMFVQPVRNNWYCEDLTITKFLLRDNFIFCETLIDFVAHFCAQLL